MSEKKDGTKFPLEVWNEIDDTIIRGIIKDIEKHEKIGEKYTINFINIISS